MAQLCVDAHIHYTYTHAAGWRESRFGASLAWLKQRYPWEVCRTLGALEVLQLPNAPFAITLSVLYAQVAFVQLLEEERALLFLALKLASQLRPHLPPQHPEKVLDAHVLHQPWLVDVQKPATCGLCKCLVPCDEVAHRVEQGVKQEAVDQDNVPLDVMALREQLVHHRIHALHAPCRAQGCTGRARQ